MNILERILVLIPDAQFGFRLGHNNEYDYIIWSPVNTSPLPTLAEITAVTQVQLDSANYPKLRAGAYAPLTDQLDMQYKDALNGTTTWQDHITAVKAMYPKVV